MLTNRTRTFNKRRTSLVLATH